MKHSTKISRSLIGLTLLLGAWLATAADDARHLARPLGTDPASVIQTGTIARGDWMDYYTFTLTEKRAVSAMLSGLSVDANLYLMNTSGQVVKIGNARNGVTATGIRQDLAAGTYFLAVYAWDRTRTSNYKLDVRTWIPVTGGITKNMGTVDGMGGLNSTKSDSGRISFRTGWVDYWFVLPDTRTVTMAVSSPAGAALFNSSQRFQALLQNGRLTRTLPAGRHFVRLFRDPARDINYSISVRAATPSTNDTAGNDRSRARFIGTMGTNTIAVNEYVGRYDFDDFFRVTVPGGRSIQVKLSQRGENANIWLQNASGAIVASSTNLGRAAESLTYTVPGSGAVTMYVRVGIAKRSGPYWEHSNFSLSVAPFTIPVPTYTRPPGYTAPPPVTDLGGNTPMLARNLFGIVPPGSGFNDRIGGGDTNDYFAFTMLKNGFQNYRQVTFSLTGMSANADIFLYQRDGGGALRLLSSAVNFSTTSETLSVSLPAYTINGYQNRYVVQIFSSSPVSSPYRLTTTVR